MRLLVDARLVGGGGIGRYVQELVARWLADARVESIRLLGRPERLEGWLEEVDARGIASVGPWRDPVYSPRAQLRWALSLYREADHADVTFFPHYDVPVLRHPTPSIVTVHDLTHYLVPDAFPLHKRLAGARLLRQALAKATVVVTISERTRRDLEGWSAQPRRITVIAPGVSPVFRPVEPGDPPQVAQPPAGPYLLMVGACRPHKNCALAVRLLAELRARGTAMTLVLAGGAAWVGEPLRLARELGVEDAVRHEPEVTDAELRHWYAGAAAVLVPSFYEGFGLPALEAMACGAPVLVSDRGSLPEAVDAAAPTLDPTNVAKWSEEVMALLGDPALRRDRIAGGLVRAAEFQWSETAEKMLELACSVKR